MSRPKTSESIGGAPQTLATYCYQCTNGPDLLKVRVLDGVATEVEPNFAVRRIHPADGKICVKPYGLLQKLYSPHRILNPLKRTNPKKGRAEDPGWVAISWEEALDIVAAKLRSIRGNLTDENGDPRLAFTTGEAGTPLRYMGAFPAFFAAWGGPIDQSLGAGGTVSCYHSEHLCGELWHRGFTVLADTPMCNYVVSFGYNVNASGGVVGVRRHADARARGATRVQIEPHLSVTGATSTDWIPIKPKTDSAFLFSMMYVLVHEHRTEELDTDFLKHRTAAPYLVAPNGYYLRDPDCLKPLLWDLKQDKAVPYDTPNIDPALTGSFVASGLERGADEQLWRHDSVLMRPAHQMLMDHVVPFTPEWASSVCDVPAETIRSIANRFLAEACIGETTEVSGRELPLRPVAILLGKGVNNGWGAYECVWARTVLQTLIGGLEVPGGLLGCMSQIVGPDYDRMASCTPGDDGFMDYPFLATDRNRWKARPEVRNAYSTLSPFSGSGPVAQALGSSTFAWLRMQARGAETWARPKPPDVWLVYRCNPLISNIDTDRLAECIAEFPFQVSFAYTHDETSHFADILLPDCTDLEATQLIRVGGTDSREQFWEAEGWVLRQAVVQPRGEAREFEWIATELAKRLGLLAELNKAINSGACGIPLRTDRYEFSLDVDREHSAEEIWDRVCRAASHDVTEGQASDGLDYYKKHGFRLRPFSKLKWYLYPRMLDLGLRFELPYQERIYRIGKQLAQRLHDSHANWWDRQLAEYEPLPHFKDLNRLWDEALERNYQLSASDFPFWVLTSRSMQYSWGGNAGVQLMKEVANNVVGHGGIQLNAQKARELGIEDDDLIEVISPIAATSGRAILREGVRPDVVVMIGQFGHWRTPYAKEFDVPSLNSLVPMHMDFLDGGGATNDTTRVKVRRVGK